MMDAVEELNAILDREDLTWDKFEAAPEGNIAVARFPFGTVTFKMRIGLHMKRPKQAIMAWQHFIRLRSRDEFADFVLTDLDPKKPDSSLYAHYFIGSDSYSDRGWIPRSPKNQLYAGQGMTVTSSTPWPNQIWGNIPQQGLLYTGYGGTGGAQLLGQTVLPTATTTGAVTITNLGGHAQNAPIPQNLQKSKWWPF